MIQIKRIYAPVSKDDGYRVLVDRLWPRGIGKDQAAIDLWLKEIAPSPHLRQWFSHDAERFEEFSALYTDELRHNPSVKQLKVAMTKNKTVTLLYAARDTEINHAVVLCAFLTK